jgi:Ser/Thr protein kinase RdoA (MazF antagonist)
MDTSRATTAIAAAWQDYGDARAIRGLDETSAHVSTNRVYRLAFDDGSHVVAKVSNYGSYFLFAEDHDRLFECTDLLRRTRWSSFLADILTKDGRPYRWYDGACWVVFYEDVSRGESLPKIVTEDDIDNLATEIAEFHRACTDIGHRLPPPSHSIRSDAVALLDQLDRLDGANSLGLDAHGADVVRRSVHDLLLHLERIDYDHWAKIPILVDWNLGNFSVHRGASGRFTLATRWDYDWFRIDSRMLDFYFLSRVSSKTGDRTQFTYSPHTLVEPRFLRFLAAYHTVNPLTPDEIEFLPWAYRFFVLNYVIREGARFFLPDFSDSFRRQATETYLPSLDAFDVSPALEAIARPFG